MNISISILQKVLLTSGLLAPLLYFGTDRLVGHLSTGYSFSAQSISDLSAIGSPQRSLAVLLTVVACIFMTAFGVGVWFVSDRVLLLRVVSVLIIGNAIPRLVATLFFQLVMRSDPILSAQACSLCFRVFFAPYWRWCLGR